jgi:hypothetical protein
MQMVDGEVMAVMAGDASMKVRNPHRFQPRPRPRRALPGSLVGCGTLLAGSHPPSLPSWPAARPPARPHARPAHTPPALPPPPLPPPPAPLPLPPRPPRPAPRPMQVRKILTGVVRVGVKLSVVAWNECPRSPAPRGVSVSFFFPQWFFLRVVGGGTSTGFGSRHISRFFISTNFFAPSHLLFFM